MWTALQVIPTVFVVVTGDDLYSYSRALALVVALLVLEGVLAVSAGAIFRRHGTKRQLVAATAFGVLTTAVAATVQLVSYSSYSGDPPWGAALVLNVIVNGTPVVLAVALGVGLAAWMERRSRRAG